MSVFRVPKKSNYTVMSNTHLRDITLSLKAKGLLSYMLSNPDDWDYSVRGLASRCRDGIDSVRTGIKELEEHLYLKREKIRDPQGHIIDYDYQVFEEPYPDTRNRQTKAVTTSNFADVGESRTGFSNNGKSYANK